MSNEQLIPRERLMVAVTNHVDLELSLAEKYALGAEIQVFGLPEMLNGDAANELDAMAKRVRRIAGPIGFHGPFIDMPHYSTDKAIRDVCRKRYRVAFEQAEILGASFVLFHTQYNPVIKVSTYADAYHENSVRFWSEFLDEAEARKLPIYIENMFDAAPDPILRLAHALDSPYFKLCLDVAHAAIHSELTMKDWVDALGPHLAHVHLNDCNGEMDDHLGLGMGSLDIRDALNLLKDTGLPLTYALETGPHTETSLAYLDIDAN